MVGEHAKRDEFNDFFFLNIEIETKTNISDFCVMYWPLTNNARVSGAVRIYQWNS